MKDEKEQWPKIWRKNVPCRPTNQSKNMEVIKTVLLFLKNREEAGVMGAEGRRK